MNVIEYSYKIHSLLIIIKHTNNQFFMSFFVTHVSDLIKIILFFIMILKTTYNTQN